MAVAGGHNDYIRLDTGRWACRWVWLERLPHEDVREEITLVGCTHDSEDEAKVHIADAAAQRMILERYHA